MTKLLLFIVSTILSLLAIASGFTMLGSSDSAMQALGSWYLLIGVLLMALGFLAMIAADRELKEKGLRRR